jgi:transcriptional regulator with XRE-family HTH domain
MATTFGEKLLALAAERRLKYPDLAAIAGTSTGTIDRWVNHGKSPRLDQVVAYARHFGVPVGYLADDAQETIEPAGDGLTEGERILVEVFRGLDIGSAEAIRRLHAAPEKAPAPPRIGATSGDFDPRGGQPRPSAKFPDPRRGTGNH